MRDRLEGDRPADMEGVDLRKTAPECDTRVLGGRPGRIHVVLGWLLAAVALAIGVRTWMDHASPRRAAASGRVVADMRRSAAPERTYVSSRMENVVVAEFTPAVRDAEDEYAASVRLVGPDGMEMTRRLPLSCQDGPVEARVGRVIRIRSDFWRLRGDGEERLLSPDDAEAALCGDFAGRDVPRARPEAAPPVDTRDDRDTGEDEDA